MLQNDYLMRQIMLFVEAIRRMMLEQEREPGESAEELETSLANALEIDPGLLSRLAPESLVTVLQLGNFDYGMAPYVARGLGLAAYFHEQAGDLKLAELRVGQLDALARAYDLDIGYADCQPQALEGFLAEGEGVGEGDGGGAPAPAPGAPAPAAPAPVAPGAPAPDASAPAPGAAVPAPGAPGAPAPAAPAPGVPALGAPAPGAPGAPAPAAPAPTPGDVLPQVGRD